MPGVEDDRHGLALEGQVDQVTGAVAGQPAHPQQLQVAAQLVLGDVEVGRRVGRADALVRLQVRHEGEQPRQPFALAGHRPPPPVDAVAAAARRRSIRAGRSTASTSSGGSSAQRRRAGAGDDAGQHADVEVGDRSARRRRRTRPAGAAGPLRRRSPERARSGSRPDRGRRRARAGRRWPGARSCPAHRTRSPRPSMRDSRKLRASPGRGRGRRRTSAAATTARPRARGCAARPRPTPDFR